MCSVCSEGGGVNHGHDLSTREDLVAEILRPRAPPLREQRQRQEGRCKGHAQEAGGRGGGRRAPAATPTESLPPLRRASPLGRKLYKLHEAPEIEKLPENNRRTGFFEREQFES